MTPKNLSHLYGLCFPNERCWSADEFATLHDDPAVMIESTPHAFAIMRLASDEAELLSIATAPEHRKKGVAKSLFDKLIAKAAQARARQVFLDVAITNIPAICAYKSWGFVEVGRRKGYYLRQGGTRVDALVLRHTI